MLLIRHLLDGLPRQYEGLKSIFIMPLIGVLVIGVMMVLLGQPVAAINNGMMNWLSSLQEANPILLGIVVGAMCSLRLRRAGQQSGLCHRYVAAGSR